MSLRERSIVNWIIYHLGMDRVYHAMQSMTGALKGQPQNSMISHLANVFFGCTRLRGSVQWLTGNPGCQYCSSSRWKEDGWEVRSDTRFFHVLRCSPVVSDRVDKWWTVTSWPKQNITRSGTYSSVLSMQQELSCRVMVVTVTSLLIINEEHFPIMPI